MIASTYGDIHSLAPDLFHTPHDVLLHLHELRQLLGQLGTKCACRALSEGMS